MAQLTLVSTTPTTNARTFPDSGDWAYFKASGVERRNGGGSLFSDITRINPDFEGTNGAGNDRTFSWSNGTPSSTGTNVTGNRYERAFNAESTAGQQITCRVDSFVRTYRIHVGYSTANAQAQGTMELEVSLSDGSASPISSFPTLIIGSDNEIEFIIDAASATDNQVITIAWRNNIVLSNFDRHVSIRAAEVTNPRLTVYPASNPRFEFGTFTSWASCRSSTTSSVSSPSQSVIFQGENNAGLYIISRIGYVFDTSAIPDGATITSAVFSVSSNAGGNGSETTNPANGALVSYSPVSDLSPAAGDYANFGTTRYADTDVTRATFSGASGYNSWTLNATGLAAISKTGNTKLGIRTSNDFSDATAPTARSYATGYYTPQTGTADDPKLDITFEFVSQATASFIYKPFLMNNFLVR